MEERENRTAADPSRSVDGRQLRRELRRAAAWTALVLIALAAIHVLLVPFTDPLNPRASRQTEASYMNRALEVRYTLPEGWTFVEEAQLDAMTQEILMGAGGGARGGQLMMAHKPGSSLNVQLQCTGGYRSQKLDGESLRAVIDQSLYQLPEGAWSEWLEPVRLGKLTYERIHMYYEFMGLDIEQYALIGGHGDYIAIIFLTGQADECPEALLSDFSSYFQV